VKRATALGAVACLVLSACGSSTRPPAPATRTTTTTVHTMRATTTAKPPAPKRKRKPKPDPGSLPQTNRLPSAATAQFHTEMAALWRGVTQDSLREALPAFFPRGAYLQVKAIANAGADYVSRLLGDYRLDLGAAHALLGGQPAQLVTVDVPATYAHWVSPEACYNRVGYYEVPNARVLYRQNGQLHSFGIASMISWRGVWYVVHLGAVLRSAPQGVVDDPSRGAGVSAPSSTC
jgi:hypothetical protein